MVEIQTRRDVELVTALLNAAVQVVVDTEHAAFRDTSDGSPQAFLDAKEMTAHALFLVGHVLHRATVPLELVGTEDALVAHVVVVPVAAFGDLPLTGDAVGGTSERLDLRVLYDDTFDDPAVVGCRRHRVGIHEANPTVLRHQCRELVVRFAEVLFARPRDIVVNVRCHAWLGSTIHAKPANRFTFGLLDERERIGRGLESCSVRRSVREVAVNLKYQTCACFLHEAAEP